MFTSSHIKLIIRATLFILFVPGLAHKTTTVAQTVDAFNFLYLPMVANQFNAAWHWQPPDLISLTPTPNTNDPLLLTIDAAGEPHLIYDTLYTPRFIFHTYHNIQVWITPTQIANTLGTSYTLFPPVRDNQGTVHLLWRNWLGSGVTNPYRLMYSSYANGAWSDEEEVARFSSEIQSMVRPDQNGMLHVTSASTIFFSDIRHFTHTPSAWSPPVSISLNHPTTWIWPDYRGGAHFYGKETYPNETVLYSYWRDGQYQIDSQRIPGELSSGDSQLDGQNNLNMFRRAQVPVPGGTVLGIYHRCLTHEMTWTDELVLSGQTDTLAPLVKAEDGHTQMALAWQESSENVVQVRVFEACLPIQSASMNLPAEFSWELETVAISQSPDMLCLVARRMYSSREYLVQCAMLKP